MCQPIYLFFSFSLSLFSFSPFSLNPCRTTTMTVVKDAARAGGGRRAAASVWVGSGLRTVTGSDVDLDGDFEGRTAATTGQARGGLDGGGGWVVGRWTAAGDV
uniref:Secreted protein n=1 Tax=Oryza brachyantha TaxID=4533 RepID=J3MXH3_ORYBR